MPQVSMSCYGVQGRSTTYAKSTLNDIKAVKDFNVIKQNNTGDTCVDFSFCCINDNPMTFSLEQNILVVSRLEATSMFCSREKVTGLT